MVSTISKREYPNSLFQNNNFVKKLIGFVGLLVSPWLFHSSEQIHAPTKSRKLFIFSSFYNTNTCIVYVTCRTIQKIIRGRIFVTHTTREWDINHPGARQREKTHLTWRKDPCGAGQLHRRLLDNHEYLTASGPISLSLSIMFSFSHHLLLYPPTLQSSSSLTVNADSQFPQFELGKEALRPPGFTLGERWGGGGRCAT